jgi:hypothetical protein
VVSVVASLHDLLAFTVIIRKADNSSFADSEQRVPSEMEVKAAGGNEVYWEGRLGNETGTSTLAEPCTRIERASIEC